MTQIKVYPPTQLPDRGVSETQFKIWLEELEVYLSQEEKFQVFLEGGDYALWESQEENSNRITELKGADLTRPNRSEPSDTAKLKERIRDLRTVLSIVGKCVSEGHYEAVVRHSTSMESIFKNLRCDYDIQQKGIHFLNILDEKYEPSKQTPVAFYNQYRTLIANNLSRKSDVINYKKETMKHDEKMSPMIEDLVLLNVIKEIDPRLPKYVKQHYTHKMTSTHRLMDFKNDILNNVNNFIQDIEKEQMLSSIRTEDNPRLAWMKGNQQRRQPQKQSEWKKTKLVNQRKYCRLCHKCDLPKEIFTSHNIGDKKCTQLSAQDRKHLGLDNKLTNISTLEEKNDLESDNEESYAKEFGYETDTISDDQVNPSEQYQVKTQEHFRYNGKLGYIAPVPTQLLTVFIEEDNKTPIHIDIDSGATLNYAREKDVLNLGIQIFPNGQLSTLGDGRTRLPSVGEIDVSFFRNKWRIRFRALVTKELQSSFIGGTVFLVDNYMEQDLNRKLIHIHNRKVTVQETNPITLMPIQAVLQSGCPEIPRSPSDFKHSQHSNHARPRYDKNQPGSQTLHTCLKQVILPGQSYEVVTKHDDNEVVAVHPWEKNLNPFWPEPQLCTVKGGKINIENKTDKPVILQKDVKFIKILSTSEAKEENEAFYTMKVPSLAKIKSEKPDYTDLISFGKGIEPDVKEAFDEIHAKHKEVFNKDLTSGYNDFYGHHRCKLNWSSNERPAASKVRVPHYNHELQGLQQELMDDLTEQGVLLVPQEHDVIIQAVCPSFLQRKQRAKDKPQHMLTKDDMRLLINFGPINDKIKPIPANVAKTEDILIKLGRWKEIIIFDLYNGYFQIKMSENSLEYRRRSEVSEQSPGVDKVC